jgi:cytochrome P450
MEPEARTLARMLLDAVDGRTHVDFVEVFARPFPVHVALKLVGLPSRDAQLIDNLVVASHEEVATGVKTGAGEKLTKYVERSLLEKRDLVGSADENLVSSILFGTVNGRPLTLDEQISMMRMVLVGGFDTTAIALATAIWWLADHPEDAQRLRDDPALIEKAGEEVVRFASLATYLRRTVTQETELGGASLRKGDWIVLAFGAANRDPAAFECPEQLKLDRSPNNHVGFGMGIHRCIGSFVAKLEMRVALSEVLSRYHQLRLDPAAPIRYSSGLNQGITSVPVILG